MTDVLEPAGADAGTGAPPVLDVRRYLTIPRVGGLALSPDGSRLVAPVQVVGPDGTSFVTSLWEIDPRGDAAPRRLTRSAPGESHGGFEPDGSLLFTSTRPDPDAKAGDGKPDRAAALWRLPAGGGEAELVAAPDGGVTAVAIARDAGAVVCGVSVLPGSPDLDDDRERATARTDAGVTALLFDSYPIRSWDHYVGPRETRLHVVEDGGEAANGASRGGGADGDGGGGGSGGAARLRDLTPDPGRTFDDLSLDVTPDGSTVVATVQLASAEPTGRRFHLVAIDVATGERRVLADDEGHDLHDVACSPDGASVVCVRARFGTPDEPSDSTLWLVDLATGEGRDVTPDLDLWPHSPVWSPSGDAVFFSADEKGHAPLFRLDVASGAITRLTAAGGWSHACPSPDGASVYALCDDLSTPPHARRLDAREADQEGTPLRSPGVPLAPPVPGRVEELIATAGDGTPVQAWLVLPHDASAERPAPLVTFIHGGPLASWHGWQWRWNPQLLAAQGYAVLLPNPALSTGFGLDFVRRGRGVWGREPYLDVLAAVDAAVERPDVDETRTAAMGGSFGGYMSNWVAGHTDRFRCIVTHASLWSLDQFHGSTDHGVWWEREFGDFYAADRRRYEENSPHRHVADIRTPMLVIHGELDHRVPISEGLKLWTDLQRHGVESKFLYFPDENHWILKPQNIVVWYDTVLAWLGQHVLGAEWTRPEHL